MKQITKELMWVLQRNVPTEISVLRCTPFENTFIDEDGENEHYDLNNYEIFRSLAGLQTYHSKELNRAIQDQQEIIDDARNEQISLENLKKLLDNPKYINKPNEVDTGDFYGNMPRQTPTAFTYELENHFVCT